MQRVVFLLIVYLCPMFISSFVSFIKVFPLLFSHMKLKSGYFLDMHNFPILG
jgi:hypothetical protein